MRHSVVTVFAIRHIHCGLVRPVMFSRNCSYFAECTLLSCRFSDVLFSCFLDTLYSCSVVLHIVTSLALYTNDVCILLCGYC